MNIFLVTIAFAVILWAPLQLSYADSDSFTVNVPNAQGGYTALVIKTSGTGYVGPQGEYYASFPTVVQLQNVYGLTNPASAPDQSDSSQTDDDNVSVTVAPPELPVYVQPEAPGPDYVWTPGYWAYDALIEDYYWVPGTWVEAPSEGLLWTPGYWYYREGQYCYSRGYWGPHVGFYGGINYGHGYQGDGNSSFNGGPGGTNAKPTSEQRSAMKEHHVPPTSVQTLQVQAAVKNTGLRASVNHGTPAIAATVKPGVFQGKGIVPTKQRGAVYKNTKPIIAIHAPKVKKPLPKPGEDPNKKPPSS